MSDRNYGLMTVMLVGLLLMGAAVPLASSAQDLDPYHAFIVELLETEYNISVEGSDFVLGTDANVILDNIGNYGVDLIERRAGDPGDVHPFDYIHVEVSRLTNPWDAGINYAGTTPIVAGETGLAIALVRGEAEGGAEATSNWIFELSEDPWTKSLETPETYNVDWELVLKPFSFVMDYNPGPPGGSQWGQHLAIENQWIDFTAPVVINFHDAYTPEMLQGMIDSGGGTPTIASISASATTGPAPLEVTFDASGSTSGGTITTWAWDFGDNNTGSGETVTHTFQDMGRYTVTLTVTDDAGVSATDTQVITVTSLEGSLEQPLEVVFASTAPTIDGERDAVWDEANTVSIATVVSGAVPADDADLSGTAQLLWDHEYLYVLYEINDEALFNNSTDSWRDDAVDFYLDPGNDKAGSYDLAEDLQHEYGWDAAVVTGKGPLTGSEGLHAFSTTETGYNIEAALAWDSLGVEATNDVLFGVEFMINDDDGSGADPDGNSDRQTKLAWFAFEDNSWQFPYLFANAKLVGEIVAAEPGSELPDAFAIESVYPNPFNPSTTVAVQVRELGDYKVRAFNVLGQKVLEQDFKAASTGRQQLNLSFESMPSGLYTVSVQNQASGQVVSTTAVLLK